MTLYFIFTFFAIGFSLRSLPCKNKYMMSSTASRDTVPFRNPIITSKIQNEIRNENRNKNTDNFIQCKFLCRMITIENQKSIGSEVFQYNNMQIEERIRKNKIPMNIPNLESGLLPLRYAIRANRRDIVQLLLKYGAKPTIADRDGIILKEVLESSKPGYLHILTDLLEHCETDDPQLQYIQSNCIPARQSMKYWLQRASRHILPRDRLAVLGIPRLNALKYRVVGQSFALEQILSEVASYHVNSELSAKPLVMLFSGPPGHGKSETAKQLSDLLKVPFIKIDCRNNANAWEMFGSGVGYIGSESGSELGNFMELHHDKRNIILLDEFDFCDSSTWEGFYHVFDEGEYTLKKTPLHDGSTRGSPSTRILNCSKSIFLLTTNKFDNDINLFNNNNENLINDFLNNKISYNQLHIKFDEFIRPKLRNFFQGGLTRRIDAIIPFFKFSEEEAYIVADMYIDKIRHMYSKNPNVQRKIGNIYFDITNVAAAELSKGYNSHKFDGASSIKREINLIILKYIHLQWIRKEDGNNNMKRFQDKNHPMWVHHEKDIGFVWKEDITVAERNLLPYFLINQMKQQQDDNNNDNNSNNLRSSLSASRSTNGRVLEVEVEDDEAAILSAWKDPYVTRDLADVSTNIVEVEDMNVSIDGLISMNDDKENDNNSNKSIMSENEMINKMRPDIDIDTEITLNENENNNMTIDSSIRGSSGNFLTKTSSYASEVTDSNTDSENSDSEDSDTDVDNTSNEYVNEGFLTISSRDMNTVEVECEVEMVTKLDDITSSQTTGVDVDVDVEVTNKIKIDIVDPLPDHPDPSHYHIQTVDVRILFHDNTQGILFKDLPLEYSPPSSSTSECVTATSTIATTGSTDTTVADVIRRVGKELPLLTASKGQFRCWMKSSYENSNGDIGNGNGDGNSDDNYNSIDQRLSLETMTSNVNDGNSSSDSSNSGNGYDGSDVGYRRVLTSDITDNDGGIWRLCRYPEHIKLIDLIQKQPQTQSQSQSSYTEVLKDNSNQHNTLTSSSTSTSSFTPTTSTTPFPPVIELFMEVRTGSSKWPKDHQLNQWRENLRIGDIVDTMRPSDRQWHEAKVIRVETFEAAYRKEPMIHLHFLGYPDNTDVVYTCSSTYIQPLYSQSEDWRSLLNIGQRVDIRVTGNHWVSAIIQHLDEVQDEVQVELELETERLLQVVQWSGEDIAPRYTHVKLKWEDLLEYVLDNRGERLTSNNYNTIVSQQISTLSLNFNNEKDDINDDNDNMYNVNTNDDDENQVHEINNSNTTLQTNINSYIQNITLHLISLNSTVSQYTFDVPENNILNSDIFAQLILFGENRHWENITSSSFEMKDIEAFKNAFRIWYRIKNKNDNKNSLIDHLVDTNDTLTYSGYGGRVIAPDVTDNTGHWSLITTIFNDDLFENILKRNNNNSNNNTNNYELVIGLERKYNGKWHFDKISEYWRKTLQKGDVIDVYDNSTEKWTHGIVTDIIDRKKHTEQYYDDYYDDYYANSLKNSRQKANQNFHWISSQDSDQNPNYFEIIKEIRIQLQQQKKNQQKTNIYMNRKSTLDIQEVVDEMDNRQEYKHDNKTNSSIKTSNVDNNIIVSVCYDVNSPYIQPFNSHFNYLIL